MSFDPHTIRGEFPILGRTVHGKPLIYLDNAASAQKPNAVIDAMANFQRTSYANVHRGLHTLANEATETFEAARRKAAAFIGAGSELEIVFTKGATEAINLVANAFASRLKPGDEIIITEMEHHANIVPWHMVAQKTGAKLVWIGLLPDGGLDEDQYLKALGPRTRLVAITHMSNVLGTLNPITRLAKAAHDVGAEVLLDGCQSVVHETVDVGTLGADYFVFSGHKLYGPTAIGCLWARPECLDVMPPWQGGGEMIQIVSKAEITYNQPPFRFEAGTPAITEAVGLGAAIDWISAQDRDAIKAHEHALYQRARDGVRQFNDVRVYGETPDKGAILAFSVDKAHPHDVAQLLDRYGVAVRAGHHCAQPLMTTLGVTATARASFAAYNTFDEVDGFIEALGRARDFLL